MKPGPRARPTLLKKFEGNPGKRQLPKNEPKPKSRKRTPQAPSFLSTLAKKEWKRIAGELHRLGLLTDLDITALAAYCQNYEMFIEAVENIKKHGVLVKQQSGFPVQSPYLNILNQATDRMKKWMVEFGMTPSSRTGVAVSKDTKKKARGQDLLT